MNASAAFVFLVVVAVTGPCSNQRAGPQPNPRTGYVIEVSERGGPFETVRIDAEGNGCERFGSVEDLERTCFITTVAIPRAIGGEAYGELNERRTPAFDALIWRALAEADASICERGGLVGPLLVECQASAVDPSYTYRNGPFQIHVPLGGAEPLPSATSLP